MSGTNYRPLISNYKNTHFILAEWTQVLSCPYPLAKWLYLSLNVIYWPVKPLFHPLFPIPPLNWLFQARLPRPPGISTFLANQPWNDLKSCLSTPSCPCLRWIGCSKPSCPFLQWTHYSTPSCPFLHWTGCSRPSSPVPLAKNYKNMIKTRRKKYLLDVLNFQCTNCDIVELWLNHHPW